jgi:hypothetical protein
VGLYEEAKEAAAAKLKAEKALLAKQGSSSPVSTKKQPAKQVRGGRIHTKGNVFAVGMSSNRGSEASNEAAYAAAAAVHAPEEYAVADSYAVACDDGFDYVGVERSVSYGADVGVGADEAPCDATYDTAVGGAAEAAEWAYAAAYYAAESAEVATEAAEVATAASAARFASGISAAAGGNGGVDGEGGGLWSGISSWFMDGATPIEGVHALDNFE